MRHLVDTWSVNLLGSNRVAEPTVLSGSTTFLSDGTGGLTLDHLYIKTPSTLFDLTGAAAGGISGGVNVGSGSGVYKGVAGPTLSFRSLRAGSNITLVQNTNDITITAGASGYETLSTSTSTTIGSVENTEFIINTSGTSSGAVPSGTVLGEKRNIFVSNITLGGTLVLTGSFVNGTTLTFSVKGQSVSLIWNSLGSYSILGGNVFIS